MCMVMMTIALLFESFHATIKAIYFAAGSLAVATLELNGRVTDVVLFTEHSG